MSNPLEEMDMPCPMDICDGSGFIAGRGDEDDRPCPHTDTRDHDANDEL